MKEINLTQGLKVKVDNSDYSWLIEYNWFAKKCKGYIYAATNIKGQSIYMHRMIMGFPEFEVDHFDGDTLNCQRNNLREATHQQNQCNKKGWGSNKYKGVSERKDLVNSKNIFKAFIVTNGKYIGLGHYQDEILAAQAYDRAAKLYHKEFAKLNFPNND